MSSIEIFGKYILLTVIVSGLVFGSGEQSNVFCNFQISFQLSNFHLNWAFIYLGCWSRGPIFNLLTLMI